MLWKVIGGVLGALLPIPIYVAMPVDVLMPGIAFAVLLQVPILGAWGGVNVGARSSLAVIFGTAGWLAALWVAEANVPRPSFWYAGLVAGGLTAGIRLGFFVDRKRGRNSN